MIMLVRVRYIYMPFLFCSHIDIAYSYKNNKKTSDLSIADSYRLFRPCWVRAEQ
jgi:hypothetical protein